MSWYSMVSGTGVSGTRCLALGVWHYVSGTRELAVGDWVRPDARYWTGDMVTGPGRPLALGYI